MGLLDDAIREHLDLKRRRGADPADVERAEREALGPVRRAPTSQNVEVADQQQAEAGFAYDHEGELGWSGDPLDAPTRASGTARRDRDLEPEFEDESLLEHRIQPEPEHRPSRLARIFGRAEPDPEPDPEPELAEPEFEESKFEDPVVMPHPAPAPAAAPAPRFSDSSGASRPGGATPAPGRSDSARTPDAEEPLDPLEQPEPDRSALPPHPAAGLSDKTTEYQVEPALHPEPPVEGEDVLEETPEFLQDTPDHDRLWFEQRPPKDFDFDG